MIGIPDACPEHDQGLMDAAIDGRLTPALHRHLADCSACRDALRSWRATSELVRAATADGAGPGRLHPGHRFRALRASAIAAGGLLAAAVVLILTRSAAPAPTEPMTVQPEIGAVVTQVAANRARIEHGTSTFVVPDEVGYVETPSGTLSCARCEFTVEVVCDPGGGASLPPALHGLDLKGLFVSVTVASGQVGSTLPGRVLMVGPGESVTLPH